VRKELSFASKRGEHGQSFFPTVTHQPGRERPHVVTGNRSPTWPLSIMKPEARGER
jgi:hypothetical protein